LSMSIRSTGHADGFRLCARFARNTQERPVLARAIRRLEVKATEKTLRGAGYQILRRRSCCGKPSVRFGSQAMSGWDYDSIHVAGCDEQPASLLSHRGAADAGHDFRYGSAQASDESELDGDSVDRGTRTTNAATHHSSLINRAIAKNRENNQEGLRSRSRSANRGTANAAVTRESRNRRRVKSGAEWFKSTRCVIARMIW